MKTAVARIAREAVRLSGTQRQTASLLGSLGWAGRGGGPIGESTVSAWVTGRNPPSAWELVALVIHHGISTDEIIHGTGLRAQVAQLERDLELLAGVVTRHIAGEQPEAEGRLGRDDAEPA